MQVLSSTEVSHVSGALGGQVIVHPIPFPIMNPNPPYIGGPIHPPVLA